MAAAAHASRSMLLRPVTEGMAVPLALSAAFHIVLLGGGILFYSLKPGKPPETRPIVAKLVRLGKSRDPHLLPRKEPAAVAPAAGPMTVPVPGGPKAPASGKTKPRELSREARMLQALARVQAGAKPERTSEEIVEGDEHGDPEGDAAHAEEGDRYLGLVVRALRQNYVLPATIGEEQRASLRATVVVYVLPNGKILRHYIEESSGNNFYDRALEMAIKRTTLPPPPPALAGQFREEGIGFVFKVQ